MSLVKLISHSTSKFQETAIYVHMSIQSSSLWDKTKFVRKTKCNFFTGSGYISGNPDCFKLTNFNSLLCHFLSFYL